MSDVILIEVFQEKKTPRGVIQLSVSSILQRYYIDEWVPLWTSLKDQKPNNASVGPQRDELPALLRSNDLGRFALSSVCRV